MILKNLIHKILFDYFLKRKRKETNAYELFCTLSNTELKEITSEQKKSITNLWKEIISYKPTFEYWQLYKTFGHFSELFVPDDAYMPIIIRALNPGKTSKVLEDKGMYPIRLKEIPQPELILNCIRGVYYNSKGEIVSPENIAHYFKNIDSFIIKRSKSSCSGMGVQKIDINDRTNFIDIFANFGDDFICQKIVKQSPKTAKFHPDSLNTFRISSLYINGNATVDTIMFKHGNNGCCVDNGHAGGLFIGVEKDGQFKDYAYDAYYNRYDKSPSGVVYKTVKIPEVTKLIDTVLNWHKTYFPDLGFIGWDVALDINNEPVFIEANICYPGILIVQLSCDTPIFGDRTNEVIEYTNKNLKSIKVFDFIGSSL